MQRADNKKPIKRKECSNQLESSFSINTHLFNFSPREIALRK